MCAAICPDMTDSRNDFVTLRRSRKEFSKLGWAFVLSITAHLILTGGYLIAKYVVLPVLVLTAAKQQPIQPKPQQPNRPMLTFVDVSEIQAAAQEPKDAKHYSDRSSIASNPDLNKDLNDPKIDGTQKDTPQTEDASRKKFDQLMPDPPKPRPLPGTMTIAKADLNPQPDKKKPRTIKEALLQRNIQGQKMKQDGGAQQRHNTSLDVKATGFGAYDRAFIDAVQSRWYDLLDNMSYDAYRQGRVVVQFVLNYDGRITEMKVVESSVSETLALLCQKAVLDPAPFDKWPREMRLMVGEDSRRITFTFNYN
jgi:outer membrane biosynthesis protein TonB